MAVNFVAGIASAFWGALPNTLSFCWSLGRQRPHWHSLSSADKLSLCLYVLAWVLFFYRWDCLLLPLISSLSDCFSVSDNANISVSRFYLRVVLYRPHSRVSQRHLTQTGCHSTGMMVKIGNVCRNRNVSRQTQLVSILSKHRTWVASI